MAGCKENRYEKGGIKGLSIKMDMEWVELLTLARAYGISIEEVRAFLQETSEQNKEVLVVK